MRTKDGAKFNIVLASGIVEKRGKFLIAQRSYEEIQAPGKWSIPGGKVEVKGEELNVIERTLRKEIKEEVGVEIEDKLVYLKSSSFIRVDKAPVVAILFLCKWNSGKAKPLEDSIKTAWIDIRDIDKYDFATGVKRALKVAHQKFRKIEER